MTEYDQYPNQGAYSPYEQRGYQHYDQQQQAQQPQQRSSTLERGRAVRLMRNGDPFYTGRTFVINQRKYPMLNVFLDDASQALRANFGAVRCIYTPKHGTRLRDIQDFEDHCTYVASGGERFKKLHYLDIAEGKRVATKGQSSPKLPPVRRMDVEGRALKLSRSENMVIYVYRNGDPLTLPAKVLLVKSTLQNWESVLDEVTRKVSLTNSAVLKLYALNGELITSAQQLEYNGMYAAAGKERYRRIDYPDPKALSPSYSPKMSRKSVYPRLRLPARQRRVDETNGQPYHQPGQSTVHRRYTKSDGTNTHTTTATSHGSTDHPGQRRPVRAEDYDFFNYKPQQQRRGPTKETDLDRDDGGIYKGRTNHRERPRQVDETRDTKIDLPVDYRDAQTVDEETLYGGHAGKTPRRTLPPPSHQPSTQSFSDPRLHPTKTSQKNHNDDETRYPAYGHNQNHNDYDNDSHRRTPTRFDDDQYEPPLPHSTHRQPLISSSTQTHQDQRQNYEMQHEESNIDQYREASQLMEHDYDNDDDRV